MSIKERVFYLALQTAFMVVLAWKGPSVQYPRASLLCAMFMALACGLLLRPLIDQLGPK